MAAQMVRMSPGLVPLPGWCTLSTSAWVGMTALGKFTNLSFLADKMSLIITLSLADCWQE